MEVTVAQSAGFCFGVKRAVEQVYEQLNAGKPVYTFGPIIHNEEVVNDLEKRGVQILQEPEEAAGLLEGTLVIRSHGVSKSVFQTLEKSALTIVDATCPFVKRIHRIVEEESEKDARIVIIGDAGHPEVEGIRGWSKTPAIVIGSREEAENFNLENGQRVCVVSQTTYNNRKFQELVEILLEKGYDIDIVNTICNATEERQSEAARIAESVDAMIVIGGKNSSNSRKLYEICSRKCGNTVFIQTVRDLELNLESKAVKVGITAGASTPNHIIEEVQNYVRINF